MSHADYNEIHEGYCRVAEDVEQALGQLATAAKSLEDSRNSLLRIRGNIDTQGEITSGLVEAANLATRAHELIGDVVDAAINHQQPLNDWCALNGVAQIEPQMSTAYSGIALGGDPFSPLPPISSSKPDDTKKPPDQKPASPPPKPPPPPEDEPNRGGYDGPRIFVKRSEAAQMLGIKAITVKYPEPHLMRLNILDKTIRFPLPYLSMLVRSGLIQENFSIKAAAREFMATDAARISTLYSERIFEQALQEYWERKPLPAMTASEVAGLLAVGRMTITSWIQSGELSTFQRDPNNRNSPIMIPVSEVQRITSWVYPSSE